MAEPHTAVVFSDPPLRRDKIRVVGVYSGDLPQSTGRRKLCLASRGGGLGQIRPWLGLVDLSRIPNGTLFREFHPISEMGYEHRQNRLFRVCVIWPQKHAHFFHESSEPESALFFVYRRPQGIYAVLTSKL